ncbi:LysE family translocator [Gordonia insulae]|uniref:Homoserine/homoserine lactone efflux protein n=1 Tax=Gordonia insulae TaxID=2420509 RepID=A0A3G8JHV1_9ACTN|nr:LysE family transporter [Gordonia insulae]AZG44604.1 Homoserine/homoserine lactone efflux protein [Gordonia insulae]
MPSPANESVAELSTMAIVDLLVVDVRVRRTDSAGRRPRATDSGVAQAALYPRAVQISTWVALLTACLLISFTPGAGAINTMSNALNVGFRRAIWGVLGQQAALLIQLLVVAAGLGVVIAGSPTAFAVIRYLGAAYLVYLGVRQFLRRPDMSDQAAETLATESGWSMFVRGLWVNLLNPKAIVFLLAFIPGFVRTDQSLTGQYAIIAVTIVVVDITVMWFFFAVVARGFRRLTGSERGQRNLNRLFGTLFVAVGIMLAVL